MSTSFLDDFNVGDKVIFTSIHPHVAVNGQTAGIVEICDNFSDTVAFPEGITVCIEFEGSRRRTWCRIDEVKKA